MIKALRIKFVAIMMSMVTLILLAIFVTMLVITQNNIERNSKDALRQSLSGRKIPGIGKIPERGPYEPPHEIRSPAIVLEYSEGKYKLISNQMYYVNEEELEEVASVVLESAEDYGILKEYSLRFMKRNNEGSMMIALADTSIEMGIIRNLAINSFLIGISAFIIFFILSIFFARWAIKPVEEAWNRQKKFIADASHELKTPLTVILSNADMLANGKGLISEKDNGRLENIQVEGIRMKRLIENMLTLAKADYVEKTTEFTSVMLNDVVMDSVLLYESAIYDDGKFLEYDIDEDIKVEGNKEKLRQLIDILLDNANKYTEKGRKIKVRLNRIKNTVLLSVNNEGEPIPQEELENIFRRFTRLDESRSNHGGFGLGLSIAKAIVDEHRGKIWAESAKENGNTFFVLLNLK